MAFVAFCCLGEEAISSYATLPELETPNKIWPFRFLKGVHIFIFFQTHIYSVQVVQKLCVYIFIFFKTQIYTHLRKSERVRVSRFAFRRKWKSEHTYENLNG